MGYAAEVISLDEVRASQQRQALRQHLHEHFKQWLDELDTQWPAPQPTLAQVSETIWTLRQSLTAGVAQTIVEQTHQAEREQKALRCATCKRLLNARLAVSRLARPLVDDVEIERPYFYCRYCHLGRCPLEAALGLNAAQIQLDIQQAAIDLATEISYERHHPCWAVSVASRSVVSVCIPSRIRLPRDAAVGCRSVSRRD